MSISETIGKMVDGISDVLGLGEGNDYTDEDVFGTFGRPEVEYEQEGSALKVNEPEYQPRRENKERNKVARMSNYKGHEVKIIDPRSYGDTRQIVDELLENKTVILNLHLLDKENAQKTIDFICGATYAINGTVQKAGDTVFVFTPQTVQLSVEAKENNAFGTNYWGSNTRL